jgi:F1F0 ATPase subunit 2
MSALFQAQPLTAAALLAVAFAAGAGLGWLFYTGLRRTVHALPHAERPALLLGASLALRMLVLLAGFWALLRAGEAWLGEGWPALAAALAGLLAARTLVLRRRDRPGARAGQTRSEPR